MPGLPTFVVPELLRTPRALRLLRVVVSALVIAAFLAALASQFGQLQSYNWRASPGYIAAAALIAGARGATLTYPWWLVVRGWGYKLDWWRAVRLYFLSGMARYLPGQWWFVLGRAHLAEREGVPKGITTAATALETVLLTGSALVTALLGIAAVPALSGYAPYLLLAAVGAAVALLYSPRPLERVSGRVLRRFKQEPPEARLGTTDTARALAGCFVNWLMYGLTAFFMLVGLGGSQYLTLAPATVGLFAASVLGGSLGLLVPQGLVIREGVLVYLLGTLLGIPLPLGVAVAALTRLLAIVAEGIWALGSYVRTRS